MAVINVRRNFTGRGGSRDQTERKVYNLVYEVITDNPEDDETIVGNGVDPVTSMRVPINGDPHPYNPLAVATDVAPEMSDDSYYIWYVTVTYDTNPKTGGQDPSQPEGSTSVMEPGNWPDNPLLEPAKWKLGSIDKQEPVREWLKISPSGKYEFIDPPAWVASTAYKKGKFVKNGGNVYYAVQNGTSAGAGGPLINGDAEFHEVVDNTVIWVFWSTYAQSQNNPFYAILSACTNSGRLPFDPPNMVDVSIPTIVVTKNLPFITLEYHMRLKNAVSISTWKGCPPRTAKVLKFDVGNENAKNGIKYVVATWEIGLDPDTWDLRPLDCGYGSMSDRTVVNPAPPPATITKRVFHRFKDPHGDPIDHAVPMDGNGGKLDPLEDPVFLRGIPKQQKLIDFNIDIPW